MDISLDFVRGLAVSAVMIRSRKSNYSEPLMVVVAEEDRVNHEKTSSMNGEASHCRRFCPSKTTKVDGKHEQQKHMLEYPPTTPRRRGNLLIIS